MKTKVMYQADHRGFFLHEVIANELALAPGHFNEPYRAYDDAPPAVPVGMLARYVDGAWLLEVDNRDKTLYVIESGDQYAIGSSVTVDGAVVSYDGGGELPAWLTDIKPVVETEPEPEPE